MRKIKRGDQVVLIAGKDKGKRGEVTRVLANGRIYVDGVNLVTKHTKPNPQRNIAGGLLEKEMPVHVSNVAIFNAATGKADRVGFRVIEDSRKVRFFKKTGEVIDA